MRLRQSHLRIQKTKVSFSFPIDGFVTFTETFDFLNETTVFRMLLRGSLL